MAISQLIQIDSFSNNFTDNLLPEKSCFRDYNNTIINTTSGSAVYTLGGFGNYDRYALYCLNLEFDTTDLVFNLSNALTTSVLTPDANHLFQLSIKDEIDGPDSFLPFDFEILIYKNAVHTDTLEGSFNPDPTTYDGKFITYYQNIYLSGTTTLDFAFKVKHNASSPTATQNFQIGLLKLEKDDKFLGVPTPYSLPYSYTPSNNNGWAYYVDSLATPTITIGTTYTQITIDALGATINNYLPLDARLALPTKQLWAGSKITPISVGDDYDGRFDFTVTAKTGSPNAIEFIIDISGSTAGSNVAFTGWIQAVGTAPYNQSMPLDYFTLSTFLTNGGKLYAKTDTGTVTIGRRNIKISRKSKAQ
mgnify:CR=1 FL=1